MDKMFEISNLFSKKVQICVDPIFEKMQIPNLFSNEM